MTTVILRPTGIATGSGSDTDIVQNAVDAAADGDTLILKARKQSDEPSGPVTPWFFAKPYAPGAHVALVSSPSGSFDANGMYTHLAVGVYDKQLTIKGDTGTSNEPITVIKGAVDQTAYMAIMDLFYTDFDPARLPGAGFVFGGGLTGKKCKIENILFKYIGSDFALFATCPMDVLNCRFEFVSVGPHLMKDNRYLGGSLIKDCRLSDCDYRGFVALGNDTEFEDCAVTGLSSAWTASAPNLFVLDMFLGWAGPWQSFLQTNTHKNVRLRRCSVDFTGSIVQPQSVVVMANSNDVVGVVENVRVEDCTFTNLAPFGNAIVVGALANRPSSIAKSCVVSGNTFTGCNQEGPRGHIHVRGARTGATPTDCLISDNTFVDCQNGPAVFFLRANSCQCVKNEYSDSDLPTNEVDGFTSAIFLNLSSNCTVYEKKQDFPTDVGVEYYATDVNGYNNLITGKNLPHMAKPQDIVSAQLQSADLLASRAAKIVALKRRNTRMSLEEAAREEADID
jgi:hypothetical protein